MLDIYCLELNRGLEKADFDRLVAEMPRARRERLGRLRRYEDAQRSLLGDSLARYALRRRTGAVARELVFGDNGYGKPLLLEPSGLHFNVSHSGSWVLCAVDDGPVGVDVEMIRPIDIGSVAQSFFSEVEYESLMLEPDEGSRLRSFYRLWTLKESYIKARGEGMALPLDSFTIVLDGKAPMDGYLHLRSYRLSDDCIASTCASSSCPAEPIRFDCAGFLRASAAVHAATDASG